MGKPRATGAGLELALAAVGVACVLVLARRVHRRGPLLLDRRVRRRLRRVRTPVLDAAAATLYLPGYPAVYFPGAALIAWSLYRRGARGATLPLTAAGAAWVTQRAVKHIVKRRRPPGRHREPGSFPSGHTTPATAIALTTAMMLARGQRVHPAWLVALTLGAPLSVGMARVYRDAHWMTDVVGGWAAGCSVALMLDGMYVTAERRVKGEE